VGSTYNLKWGQDVKSCYNWFK